MYVSYIEVWFNLTLIYHKIINVYILALNNFPQIL